MSEEQKRQLQQQLWNIANTLRGKMDADEFRDYILGFIFYKYLSEKIHFTANKILHDSEDETDYSDVDENSKEGKEIVEAIYEEIVEDLGYFLKPSELFSNVAKKGYNRIEGKSNFILPELSKILNNIEQSILGTNSEDDFEHLFEDLDLTSSKLGKTEDEKNTLISKVLYHLDEIDFNLSDSNADVLGDAYEYLIAQFASGAGKKAGEFYTPQQVSTILSRIVTSRRNQLKSVYDPTCGSGSLLLRVAREAKVSDFYGQEMNRTTYNLARMNMILHGVSYSNFDIKQEDTLEKPQHLDKTFDAIVANPPFSAKWSSNELLLLDERFSQYGKLAPASIPQVYLDVIVNGSTITIVPDYLVLQNGKYKVVDAKASSLTDLSKMGTPDLTSRLTANQKIAYPAINAGSIIAKVKSSRTNLSGTTTLAVSTITLDIGVDFYVNVPKAQYTSATKRTLK